MTSLAQSHDAHRLSLRDRYAAVHLRDMPAALAAQRRARAAPHEFTDEYEYNDEPLAVTTKRRRTRLVERHRKGPMGWLCAGLFWAWQALCVLYVVILFKAGAADSVTITLASFTWLTGTLPLAILRYVTRGRRITTIVKL
jgi:hypothetical protein